jgi:hypothetical protein
MSGATEAFARQRIGEFDGRAAREGWARWVPVATTNAGEFRGCGTEAIRPSTGTAKPPRHHRWTSPRKEDHS